jgi:DNA-directed RNA polymerase subunit RPC12/RpoP
MDYRCPHCTRSVKARKLSQSIIARMEMDCPHCKGRVRLNIHRVEEAVAFLNIAALAVLALLAYRYQSRDLVAAAIIVAFVGAASLPLIERFWLRAWPRYVAAEAGKRDS